jgi:hypothetical protein
MNQMMKVVVAGLVLVVCLAWVSTASASSITWTAGPTTITSVNDISLTGTLVSAGQAGAGTINVTVGAETIPFVYIPWDTSGAYANLSATGIISSTYGPDSGLFVPPSGFDANFASVLQTVAYANNTTWSANDGYLDLTLKGLTATHTYQLQLFASNEFVPNGTETMHYSDATSGGNSTSVFAMNTHPYFIGTFTAGGATQDVYGLQNAYNGGNAYSAILNAYVLRDTTPTPEPSAMILLITALTGLLAYAWRKRR